MMMTEKKIWCEQEDKILKQLFEEGETNWNVISRKLHQQYGFPRKSTKQCRERYQNHICSQHLRPEWSQQEQQKLITLHNQFGNKWKLIANHFQDKSDNDLKNHFYSKLRKILRKLNLIILSFFKRQYKEIPMSTLTKIVEATQQRFKEQPGCRAQVSSSCQNVQNKLFRVSLLKQQQFDTQQRISIYKQLIDDIYSVGKIYKKKNKKIKNSYISTPNFRKKKNREKGLNNMNQLMKMSGNINEKDIKIKGQLKNGYESDSSSVFEDDERQQQIEKDVKPNVVIEYKLQNIRDMLKQAGILRQDGTKQALPIIKFNEGSSFKSYSDRNDSDNQFFEDSQNQKYKRKQKSFFSSKGIIFDDPSERSDGNDLMFN